MYLQISKNVVILLIIAQIIFPLPCNLKSSLLQALLFSLFVCMILISKWDFVLSLLLCTLSIIILYSSITIKKKPKVIKSHKKLIKKTTPIINKTKSEPIQKEKEKEKEKPNNTFVPEPDFFEKHTNKMMSKEQTNVFDSLNNKLFYNELGVQHNIQGINQSNDISGYDSSIYV
jgi:hypothetical protein